MFPRKLRTLLSKSHSKSNDEYEGATSVAGAIHQSLSNDGTASIRVDPKSYNNAQQSALLQLPRELRDHILSYIYGDLVIHVSLQPASSLSEDEKCRYNICQSSLTPKECYQHAQEGASFESPHQWASATLEMEYDSFHTSCMEKNFDSDPIPFRAPVVCRQMWEEIAYMIYKSAIWYFVDTRALPVFAQSGKMAQRVQRLAFVKPFSDNNSYSQWWSWELDSRSLDHFTDLQGLDLILVRQVWLGMARSDLGDFTDGYEVIGEGARGNVRLGALVELERSMNSLRRRVLQRDKTRVVVLLYMNQGARNTSTTVEDRLELAETVREWLLE